MKYIGIANNIQLSALYLAEKVVATDLELSP
jgi:hypothetical protein